MATTDAGHSATADHSADSHGHDHDHPSYLAHHFDTPEQQFDSGKLGMWIFLVTEVLFFSGMFCAYAIYRSWRPDVFEGCSQFLNTKLGAINTGVLLFSSFTMAWAVRASQLEQHKKTAALIASTLCCAMIFLGVKAIEYSHKWTMGLLPAGLFTYDPSNPHPVGGPNYLAYICAPFAVATVGIFIWLVVSFLRGAKFQFECAKPILVVFLCFFVGVGLGTILESGGSESHGTEHAAHVEGGEHDSHAEGEHAGEGEHAAESHEQEAATEETAEAAPTEAIAGLVAPGTMVSSDNELDVIKRLAADTTNTGLQGELAARQAQNDMANGAITYHVYDDVSATVAAAEENVMRKSRAGVFFSIYYCMTGVHAIHILAGIGVLIWLLVRALRQDFNKNYFGPVDYVGLYWHLVDLIWIYLFPLMYLIR
ncbi:cytochrome c oxidase subunit 3 [Rhodopirellula sp. MGV]|uniref:cytochrome c oxidase subunit 3 n=1 Tax=Rhodopirellula sp. MGV TaxID=2023130 RepID=UPI000B96A7B3|nr:cytochrome c oxidase subunit 3 [Rhodopirellula sp. MGV]OYP31592.1 cytochrome oxidase subunit III [Rhodopirellula sp. MGV]PNY36318.1 cytochrome oxidase subunit III [Rhodopirellula baltica]PNY37723.1 cytochrome oxidase subunit III [Rhodopirellula baltica]